MLKEEQTFICRVKLAARGNCFVEKVALVGDISPQFCTLFIYLNKYLAAAFSPWPYTLVRVFIVSALGEAM